MKSALEIHPHLEGEVTFLLTKHGGRRSGVKSNYRGQFYFDNDDHDAIHIYPDIDHVELGEKVRTLIHLYRPELYAEKISQGSAFLIREGNKVVGYGAVKTILNQLLRQGWDEAFAEMGKRGDDELLAEKE
jgi:translation elongation factor EF-Tu-like GTPase